MSEKSLPFGDVHVMYKDVDWSAPYDSADNRSTTESLDEAELVSSELRDYKPGGLAMFMQGGETYHYPVLDLDIPHALVPSTREGHSHLYIRPHEPVPWSVYVRLLEALGDAGILEPGYVRVSIERGATMVRAPWVKKEGDK